MADPLTSSGAHCDNINQQFSILGVQGTLGTADVKGTAPTLPIGVNPDNGAMFVDIMGGEVIAELGTLDLLKAGTIDLVKAGTINADIRVGSTAVGTANPVPVDLQSISTIYGNTKTVPVGTAETIASSQAIRSVTVKALSTNLYPVYIGPTGVTTSTGLELLSGESVSLDVNNLNLVYCIAGTASQVIRYIAI